MDQEILEDLEVQEDQQHPSFQWLPFLQLLLVDLDLQDCQLLLEVLGDQQCPLDLFHQVFHLDLLVQEDPYCLCLPWLHQGQEYLFDQANQLTQQVLYDLELPLVLVFQVVPQGQVCLALLSFQAVQPYQKVLSLLENPWLLSVLHYPSFLEVPAYQMLHLYQAHHFYQVVQASLEILLVQVILQDLFHQQAQFDQVGQELQELHLFQDPL